MFRIEVGVRVCVVEWIGDGGVAISVREVMLRAVTNVQMWEFNWAWNREAKEDERESVQ